MQGEQVHTEHIPQGWEGPKLTMADQLGIRIRDALRKAIPEVLDTLTERELDTLDRELDKALGKPVPERKRKPVLLDWSKATYSKPEGWNR
ncbi:MAG: hypothetical protein AB7T74_13880 [Clostridia bacterium]